MPLGNPDRPFSYGRCEVCDSQFKILLRYVGGCRTRCVYPLFYCMECESFTCIQNYQESEAQLAKDVDYNLNLHAHKLEGFGRLARFLKRALGNITHADIGCSIGTSVMAFTAEGFRSSGYDLNKLAIAKGRDMFPDLNLNATLAGSDGSRFGLITMIDVLEHVSEPVAFMQGILQALDKKGYIFILVPRVDRDSWRFLSQPLADQITWTGEGPFRDNDVHIVHYSTKGLIRLAERLGLSVVADHPASEWPCNGILLRRE